MLNYILLLFKEGIMAEKEYSKDVVEEISLEEISELSTLSTLFASGCHQGMNFTPVP